MIVLLRHGQSVNNASGVFTGWEESPLTAVGRQEARDAAKTLQVAGFRPDEVHTSLLQRAIRTSEIVLNALGAATVPALRTWRLNERHYGALTGRAKEEVLADAGLERFTAWRRSWTAAPPPQPAEQRRQTALAAKYQGTDCVVPTAESLRDVSRRLQPYWQQHLLPAALAGRRVLVVSHGNTLRAFLKTIYGEAVGPIEDIDVPTAAPIALSLDGDGTPTRNEIEFFDPDAAARVAELVRHEGRGPVTQPRSGA